MAEGRGVPLSGRESGMGGAIAEHWDLGALANGMEPLGYAGDSLMRRALGIEEQGTSGSGQKPKDIVLRCGCLVCCLARESRIQWGVDSSDAG